MKKYCVDRSIAKKLKENGFPQKTDFGYSRVMALSSKGTKKKWVHGSPNSDAEDYVSSPFTEELLNKLPDRLNGGYLFIQKWRGFYEAFYHDNDFKKIAFKSKVMQTKKLSNALAKLWIYIRQLKEKKRIK